MGLEHATLSAILHEKLPSLLNPDWRSRASQGLGLPHRCWTEPAQSKPIEWHSALVFLPGAIEDCHALSPPSVQHRSEALMLA